MRTKFLLALPVLAVCFNALAAVPDGIIQQLKTMQVVQVNEKGGDLNVYMKKSVVNQELATNVIKNVCRSQYALAPGQEAFTDDPKLVDKWPADKYKNLNIVNDLGVGFKLPGGGKDCKKLGLMNSEQTTEYFGEHVSKARIDKLPR